MYKRGRRRVAYVNKSYRKMEWRKKIEQKTQRD